MEVIDLEANINQIQVYEVNLEETNAAPIIPA